MKIKQFEEIEAWKKARELTKRVYEISMNKNFNRDWTLKDQMRRAVISVMSNIAEGFDSGFNAEFVRFLNMSRRSASEVQNHLYIALDQAYITSNEFKIVYEQTEEVRKMIIGFIKYLKNYKLVNS